MRFDLSKIAILEPAWQKYYLIARILILVFFHLFLIYFFNRIFFPDEAFELNLVNPAAKENSLGHNLDSGSANIFSAFSREVFSTAALKLIVSENSPELTGQKISVRKTYAAFAYQIAEGPAAFPDGSLLKYSEKFYLVSEGKLRRFGSPQIFKALGYDINSFQLVTAEELSYNEPGNDIFEIKVYAENSLFFVDGVYYQLKDQLLFPFVSEKAFLSHYSKNQAINKDKSFLQNYTLSQDNPIGFADGSLLAFDTGVFLVAEGKVVPFNNPEIFLALGYDWNNVIPANEEEIGLYQRDKVFSIDRPHPDGTVFFAEDSQKYYLVSGKNKREIKGENILKIYLKNHPIRVYEKSLEFQDDCSLEKDLWNNQSYKCKMPIKKLGQFPGKEYQFRMEENKSMKISLVDVVLSREINWENMRNILSVIKQKVLNNYGYIETTS